MEQALQLALEWSKSNMPEKAQIQVERSAGRAPLLLIDLLGDRNGNLLMYGHLDKQPEMEGWDDDLGPWKPVLKDNKFYGRGGADDGYALFASLTVVNALMEKKGCFAPYSDPHRIFGRKRFSRSSPLNGFVRRPDRLTRSDHLP